jgi:hypothetical protein
MNYEYSGLGSAETDIVDTVNFGALSAWSQMTNKPKYWLAWQALSQATFIINDSNVMERYYAYNALEFVFDDFDQVAAGVLYGMDAATQNTIYIDQNFGMNAVHNLAVWVQAHL